MRVPKPRPGAPSQSHPSPPTSPSPSPPPPPNRAPPPDPKPKFKAEFFIDLKTDSSSKRRKRIKVVGDTGCSKSAMSEEFGWSPSVVVDVRDVAEQAGVPSQYPAILESVIGEPLCRNASRFTATVTPSAAALDHVDIQASVIYEFCARHLNFRGAELQDSLEERRARDRRHRSQGNASSSRSRSRPC